MDGASMNGIAGGHLPLGKNKKKGALEEFGIMDSEN